eukprot:7461671-Pyramimonas_sp.AAC.1
MHLGISDLACATADGEPQSFSHLIITLAALSLHKWVSFARDEKCNHFRFNLFNQTSHRLSPDFVMSALACRTQNIPRNKSYGEFASSNANPLLNVVWSGPPSDVYAHHVARGKRGGAASRRSPQDTPRDCSCLWSSEKVPTKDASNTRCKSGNIERVTTASQNLDSPSLPYVDASTGSDTNELMS